MNQSSTHRVSSIGNGTSLFGMILTVFCFSFQPAYAQESNQPYIDKLKKEIQEKDLEKEKIEDVKPPEPADPSVVDPYIQSIRKKINTDPDDSFIEEVKSKDPQLKNPPEEVQSYTEVEKLKIPAAEEGGAIQAVLDGKSDLHGKKVGDIHHAFGVKYGLSMTRAISAPNQLKNFNDIYGSNYAPDLSFFYEWQPFHSEWFGNIGIFGLGGIGYYHGQGKFSVQLTSAGTNRPFSQDSNTKFQFFSLPLVLGLNYRFNLARYLRPYIMAGGTSVGFVEMRNDPTEGSRGHTEGFMFSGGVAILLDWMSKDSEWGLYTTYGIKHAYLTLDYTQFVTFGALSYTVSGIISGFTFEY